MDSAGRRLRQSEMGQYDPSALYGLADVDKTTHDVSYSVDGGGGSIAADSAGIRNNEYARMRLQRLAGGGQPYRDGVPYGLPYRGGGRLPPPLMQGVVEHIYESPDLIRQDAFQDGQYTPTRTAAGPAQQPQRHRQQEHQQPAQSPHHGYWPLPAASHPEPTSPGAQCCGSTTKTSLKAKSTGNYSL